MYVTYAFIFFVLLFLFTTTGCSGWSPDITITDTYTRSGAGPRILPDLNACEGASKLIGPPSEAEYKARAQLETKYKKGRRRQGINVKKKTKCHW